MAFVRPKELFKVKTSKGTFVKPEGIDAYFSLISDVSNDCVRLQRISWWQKFLFPITFRTIFKNRDKVLKEVLERLIYSEELKLSTNIQYYHDSANDFSFLYYVLAQYGYYHGGERALKRPI